jgi:cyanophycinase-like exopeptidase
MAARRKPVYLIAGGRGAMTRRGPDPMIQAALREAGVERPLVAYVGAASGDNAAFRAIIGRLLVKAGAGGMKLAPLCGKRADAKRAKAVLESSHIVFISGGDVDEGMRVLERTAMIDFLKDLYNQGKPFLGVSAGSIMLARSWIRWRDPADDASAEIFPCLGIALVNCDTHGEADGWEELRALQALVRPGTVSYGIVSGSALVVRPDRTVAALGGEVHRFARKGRQVVQIDSLLPGGR